MPGGKENCDRFLLVFVSLVLNSLHVLDYTRSMRCMRCRVPCDASRCGSAQHPTGTFFVIVWTGGSSARLKRRAQVCVWPADVPGCVFFVSLTIYKCWACTVGTLQKDLNLVAVRPKLSATFCGANELTTVVNDEFPQRFLNNTSFHSQH